MKQQSPEKPDPRLAGDGGLGAGVEHDEPLEGSAHDKPPDDEVIGHA